jgi:hypothetical protein
MVLRVLDFNRCPKAQSENRGIFDKDLFGQIMSTAIPKKNNQYEDDYLSALK